ncbi:MAG TPA: response regulator [Candidatus Binataceae bacterium]|jgi:CheY-like chemotaxis protein|nr:response regulator [Candidatus Binataceae bacterium]
MRSPRVSAVSRETAAAGEPSASRREPRRILIVDDNVDAAEALGLLLESEGHRIRVVNDGAAAVACAQEFQPDAAIIDIGLPGMDGYEVARRLRELVPGTALMALSGWRLSEGDPQGYRGRFDGFFTKPMEFSKLRELLARLPVRSN